MHSWSIDPDELEPKRECALEAYLSHLLSIHQSWVEYICIPFLQDGNITLIQDALNLARNAELILALHDVLVA